MKTKILKTEQEYNEASAKIYTIINSSENSIEPDSPEGEELLNISSIQDYLKGGRAVMM